MRLRDLLMTVVAFAVFQPAWSGDLKVGLINVPRLVAAFPDAKSANQEIKKVTDKSNQALAALKSELDGLNKEYAANKTGLTAKQKKEKEYVIKKKKEDLDALHKRLSVEVKSLEGQAERVLGSRLRERIAQTAKAEGVDVVLEDNKVFYAKSYVDLTDKIIAGFPKEKPVK
jgi:Skp family chaperone for outer membrane proteins